MKNILLKFVIALGSASLFFIVFFALRSGPENTAPETNLTASVSSVFPFAADTSRILLQVPDGGVWVNNFYKKAEGAIAGDKSVLIKKAQAYDFLYYPEEGRFEIALSVWATAKDKSTAEQSLFGILGAGKADLCRLNIGVSSFNSAGDKKISILSFCGSVFNPHT